MSTRAEHVGKDLPRFPSLRDYMALSRGLRALPEAGIDEIVDLFNSEGWRIVRFADEGGIVSVLPNGNQIREVSSEVYSL